MVILLNSKNKKKTRMPTLKVVNKTATNTLHGTVQFFNCLTVGTDVYSYELTWVS